MCGVAGWLGRPLEGREAAERMAQRLAHRGPDARAVREWPNATLVHTRLAIIDLSPAGDQPMPNEDGTVWVVFNGEIYNHRELRRDLEARGHCFRGRSDTEVLPHLYEEEGAELVRRLRGMFAFAIYDAKRQKLLLARDRFGIKPIFYAPGEEQLLFASELNALREAPGLDLATDAQAMRDFMGLGYVPAPQTWFRGVRALEPGHVLEAALGEDRRITWATRAYHVWTIAPDPSLELDQVVDRADALVDAAVQRQLESDVPMGALLSGGIDSSLVSMFAQRSLPDGLRTFNVRFPDGAYDETWAALAVARHIGSHHTTLDFLGREGTWDEVVDLLRHAGQPFADTSLFAVRAVCALMRGHVTVALSGDGGDENFGGYDLYWRIARIARAQRLPGPVWKGAAAGAGLLTRGGLVRPSLAGRLAELTGADDTAVVQSMFTWLGEVEHERLCAPIEGLPLRRLFERQWAHDLPRAASRLECLSSYATEANVRLALANDFLFKVDAASMSASLEVRVPMLDEDLTAFGLTLPHRLKVEGRTCKRVLRGVAARRLPASVAEKPKHGFAVPVDLWVDGEFRERLRERLLGPATRLRDILREDVYRPWVEAFCDARPLPGLSRQGLYQRALLLGAMDLWL